VKVSETPGGGAPVDNDALIARLRTIEDLPLEERAAAFAKIHDELQAALEGADAPRSNA
jgi:hypothetical protein